jgi:hypothetical protein
MVVVLVDRRDTLHSGDAVSESSIVFLARERAKRLVAARSLRPGSPVVSVAGVADLRHGAQELRARAAHQAERAAAVLATARELSMSCAALRRQTQKILSELTPLLRRLPQTVTWR